MALRTQQSQQQIIAGKSAAPSGLLVRATPKEDESLAGFLLRLAEINFYDPPRVILSLAGLPENTFRRCYLIACDESNLIRLAELARLSIKDLSPLVYHPVDKGVMVRGQRLTQYMFRLNRARVCPECLRQSNHCRMQWDLSVITACPLHFCTLLEKCPKCRKPITWFRKGVSVCSCGCDWRDAQTKVLPDSETILARLACQNLGLISRREGKSKSNPLFDLDLPSVFEALLFIAGHQEGRGDTTGFLTLPGRPTPEIHERLLKAFAVFEAWPQNFHTFLQHVRSTPRCSRAATGLDGTFGNFYHYLYQSRFDWRPGIKLLKDAFERYLSEHWDGGYLPRTKWFNSRNVRRKYLSRQEACTALGIDPRVLDRLVSDGKLAAKVKRIGKTRVFLVEAASLKKPKVEFSGYLSLEEASRFLGITRFSVLRLVENSILLPVRSPSMDNRNHWRFERSVLQGFQAKILSKIRPVRSSHRRKLQSFASVLRKINQQLVSSVHGIHNLVSDILNGVIIPRGESSADVGLSRLLFSCKEVEGYVRKKLVDQAGQGFRLVGKVKDFGLTREVIYFLAHKGLIKSNDAIHRGRKFRTISPETVRSFKSNYVFAFEVAHRIGTSMKFLLQELQRLQVKPISGATVDYGPQYVFRRADIGRLNLKNLSGRCRKIKQRAREQNAGDVAEAAKILSVQENTITDLVKNEVLKPYRDSVDSPRDYQFNRSYIEGFKDQFKNLPNLMSKRAAAKILGNHCLRNKWLKMGYLKYEVSRDGERRFLDKVKVEEIASFMATVVTGAEAARLSEMNVNSIGYWIRKSSFKPVIHPYRRAFRSPLYLRAEVIKFRAIRVSG